MSGLPYNLEFNHPLKSDVLTVCLFLALTADEETLVRFSLKESIYKAVHPLVGRFIGLREVEVDLSDDGSAMIRFVGPAALAPTGETSVDCKQSSAFMSRSTPDLTHLRHIEAGKYWNIAQVDKHLTIQYIAQWVKLCEQYCVTAVKVLPYRSQIRPERNIDLINNEV